MIRIVNWLLTRKCNLTCDYCAIVKDYKNMPKVYPNMKWYHKNEMSTDDVLGGLEMFKKHNPDAFHIFYGGEPILRKDLATIINYCNKVNIHYTIISNNTLEIQPMISKLMQDVDDQIKGFSASVDPVFYEEDEAPDRIRKSLQGYASLVSMKDRVKDVVAEITVMDHNVQHLYTLVKKLSNEGISSDITFVDIAKSQFYDFSNVTDRSMLVHQTAQLAEEFKKLHEDKDVLVHMKDLLLRKMWATLPSNMDCEIDKSLHNVSVDADGTIRLCLRVRGTWTPGIVNLKNLFTDEGDISVVAQSAIKRDKKDYCKLCNHTCHIMSKYIDDNESGPDDLVHLDIREGTTNG